MDKEERITIGDSPVVVYLCPDEFRTLKWLSKAFNCNFSAILRWALSNLYTECRDSAMLMSTTLGEVDETE